MISGRNILQDADIKAALVMAKVADGRYGPIDRDTALLQIFSGIPMVRDSMRWKCTSCLYHSFCYIEKADQPKETLKKVKKK